MALTHPRDFEMIQSIDVPGAKEDHREAQDLAGGLRWQMRAGEHLLLCSSFLLWPLLLMSRALASSSRKKVPALFPKSGFPPIIRA